MTNEQRLEIEILANQFFLRYRCKGMIDAAEFEALCELLRALKRQWNHQENVSKSLAGLLYGTAVIAKNFEIDLITDDPQAHSAQDEMREMLIELDALISDCFQTSAPTGDLALPFDD